MNKPDLIDQVQKRTISFTKQDILESVDEILDFITKSLSKGNRIEIRGFGSFSLRARKARVGRNPSTGTAIHIGHKYHPYFRASKVLKESLNN